MGDEATKGKNKKKTTEGNATESENATSLLETFTKSPSSSFKAFSLLEESDKTALINKVLQANTQDLLDAWEDMSNSDKQRVAMALRSTPLGTVVAQVPSEYGINMQQRAVSVEQALAEKGKSVDNSTSGKKKKKANATSLQQRASVMSVEQALAEKGNKTDSATSGKKKKNSNSTSLQQRAASGDAVLAAKGKTDEATKGKNKKKTTEGNATESENATSLLETFTKSPSSSFKAFSLLEESDKTALINKVLQTDTQDLLDAWEDM